MGHCRLGALSLAELCLSFQGCQANDLEVPPEQERSPLQVGYRRACVLEAPPAAREVPSPWVTVIVAADVCVPWLLVDFTSTGAGPRAGASVSATGRVGAGVFTRSKGNTDGGGRGGSGKMTMRADCGVICPSWVCVAP